MEYYLGVLAILFFLAAGVVDRNPSPTRFIVILLMFSAGSAIMQYLVNNYL